MRQFCFICGATAILAGLIIPASLADKATSQPVTRPAKAIITLTDKAAAEIKAIIAAQELKRYWLRVGVRFDKDTKKFSYVLDITDELPRKDEDTVYESHGVPIAVDHKSSLFLMGTVIDFRNDESGKGFVFRNPNATKE